MTLPHWVVTSATPRTGHTIELIFADGISGHFDCGPLLADDAYAPLAELSLFMRGHASCGAVVWSDELDLVPELLCERCERDV